MLNILIVSDLIRYNSFEKINIPSYMNDFNIIEINIKDSTFLGVCHQAKVIHLD